MSADFCEIRSEVPSGKVKTMPKDTLPDTHIQIATELRRLSWKVDDWHLKASMQAGAQALTGDLATGEAVAVLKAVRVVPPAGDVPAIIAKAIQILESGQSAVDRGQRQLGPSSKLVPNNIDLVEAVILENQAAR